MLRRLEDVPAERKKEARDRYFYVERFMRHRIFCHVEYIFAGLFYYLLKYRAMINHNDIISSRQSS